MVELEHVSQTYAGRNGSVPVLKDVSLTIKDGEFVAFVGPSGCGKTTLLRLVSDLLQPSAGAVYVDHLSAGEARRRGYFSFMFQRPALLPWRRVVDNVRFPSQVTGRSGRDPRELLDLLGLAGWEERYPSELSGGMQQRVALARALLLSPKVLLLDEPFASLDEFSREALNLELHRVWRLTKPTALMVTHSLSEAVFLASRVVVFSHRPAKIVGVLEIPFTGERLPELRSSPAFVEQIEWLRAKLQ